MYIRKCLTWASAGIYCFWDYYAEAVLYIGLAGDLAERFRQHNGILLIREGSKQKKIEEYFSKNGKRQIARRKLKLSVA